ncbi:response regulator [Rhizobium oryzicola]|uniref:Response regulator n=1 Tax=Rhizobium oryzicola TaxID=1232668 RepID=A0ABT8SRZ9_9HYPH|nr:response regulator [Rhizobium oryzicola]MDO1581186.1 response regulator [Rhizobium oryzicola]
MSDLAHSDGMSQSGLLEIISDAISGALLIYDRNDTIVFASNHLRHFLHALPVNPCAGTRLRDFFGFLYDHGGYFPEDTERKARPTVSREDWIAGEIAALWKERSEAVERRGVDRWMSLSRRRMPSGYGICVIRDVSEHKKREDQWRADLERVQVTEEILDNLPFPVSVKDRKLACVAVNKAMCDLHGLDREDVLARRVGEALREPVPSACDIADREVLETGMPATQAELIIYPDGRRETFLTRRYRIGKPGRYFVVTIMEDVSAVADIVRTAQPVVIDQRTAKTSPVRQSHDIQPDSGSHIAGRRVLIVTEDYDAERESLTLLTKMDMDASSVRSVMELEAFLSLAQDASIAIDLMIIDSLMDVQCLEIADRFGISYVVLEGVRMREDLAPAVMHHFRYPADQGSIADEDWQIDPVTSLDVLVAEDNPVNQIVFSQILDGLGYRYAIASDGEEAVRLWQEHKPSIILMDITLPRLNGFEAAQRIRSLEERAGATPIIGVLSPAVEGDRAACHAAGMNDVVMKPLSPDTLEDKFRLYLHRPQAFQRTA